MYARDQFYGVIGKIADDDVTMRDFIGNRRSVSGQTHGLRIASYAGELTVRPAALRIRQPPNTNIPCRIDAEQQIVGRRN
jgi:hypothetical protein